jgi:hypothetical protein
MIMRNILLNRKFVLTLTLWTVLISLPPSNAFAMPSASVSAFDASSFRQAQMDKILIELSRPEARAHMMLMGIKQAELQEKLSQLDDAQLATVADKASAVKVAGDAGLGIVITILVIVILVIIIQKLNHNKRIL